MTGAATRSAQRVFLVGRRPDEGATPLVAGPVLGEVAPGLGQAQTTVRAPEYDIRIRVVLPVVLPEADIADLEATSLAERQEATNRARVRPSLRPAQYRVVRQLHARNLGTRSVSEVSLP